MADKLKPCPFCGNKKVKVCGGVPAGSRKGVYWVYCRKCGTSSGNKKTKNSAIAAWNKRVNYAI